MKTLRLMGIGGLVVASLIGCREGDTVGPTSPEIEEGFGSAVVHLPSIPADFLAKSRALAEEGKLMLMIEAPDMDPMQYSWPLSAIPAEPVVIGNIPAGRGRVFTGGLRNSGGILTHEGSVRANVEAGKTVDVHLKLAMVNEGAAEVRIEIEGLPAPSCGGGECRLMRFGMESCRPEVEWRNFASAVARMIGGKPGKMDFLRGSCDEGYQAAVFEICDVRSDCEVGIVPLHCTRNFKPLIPRNPDGSIPKLKPFFECENGGFEALIAVTCPPNRPSDPPPDPAKCTYGGFQARGCHPEGEWREFVKVQADLMGGEIAELKLHGGECGSGYREAEYVICNIRRTDCEIVVIPGECERDPRHLVPRRPDGGLPRFVPFFKCGQGGFEAIVAERCPSTPPPQPPVCRHFAFKSSQCRDEGEWHMLGSMVADMLGGTIAELRLHQFQCGKGYAGVDFQVRGVDENCSVEIRRIAGIPDWEATLPECANGGRRQVLPVLKCDDGTFEAAVVHCRRASRTACETAARDFFTLMKYGGGVCDREYDRIKRRAHTACCGSPPEYLMGAVGCEDIERVLGIIDPESDLHAALRTALFSECISSGASSCTNSSLVNEESGYDLDTWLELARAGCDKNDGVRIDSWEVREPNGVDAITGKKLYKEFTYTCCVPEP